MKKTKIFVWLLALLAVGVMTMGAGCSISFKSNDTSASDGGLWVSLDKGVSWRQVTAIPGVAGAGSIASYDVSSLAPDPSDSNALYFGSAAKGLFYSYSLANGWTPATSLNEVKINSVVVSPANKCLIYAAASNKVYRSNDCSRTWSQVYFDNDINTKINAVAIDFYNSQKVYFGNSRGEIIRSLDGGDHWATVLRAGSSVNEIVFSPQDSRKIFVTTVNDGISRSLDSGDNWTPLKDKMTEFKNSFNITQFIASPTADGLLYAATAYGLLKSEDSGDTWARIQLITPEKDASINSLAVDPKDSKSIYYVTNTTFYSSSDGGTSWRTRKLPSTRAGARLLIKPDETNVIFMGMKKYKGGGSAGAFGI